MILAINGRFAAANGWWTRLMPKTGVFLLTPVTPSTRPHSRITFALPRSGILGRKILALVVTPLVNPPKHLAGAIPTFLMRGQSFKRPNWKKRRNVELYHFWQRFGSRTRILLWSRADCKFAGFTPSVVRIHSYPSLSQSHSSIFEAAWRMTHST